MAGEQWNGGDCMLPRHYVPRRRRAKDKKISYRQQQNRLYYSTAEQFVFRRVYRHLHYGVETLEGDERRDFYRRFKRVYQGYEQ